MKGKRKTIIALFSGFAFAMILMALVIYFGYTHAYSANVDASTVSILGLPIYELTRSGTRYAGSAIGINMGIVCGVCMLIALILTGVISKFKKS